MKRPRDGARNRSSAPLLAVARKACPLEHCEHSRNENCFVEPPSSPKTPQATLIGMLPLSVGLAFQFSRKFQKFWGAASQNALQRSVNSRGTPWRRWSWRIAWAGDIGTLSLPNDHLNSCRRDSDASPLDKNAEDPIARTRKETGSPNRNQSKRTMDLEWGGRPAGLSNSIGPASKVISPPALTRNRSIVNRASWPKCKLVSLPRRIVAARPTRYRLCP